MSDDFCLEFLFVSFSLVFSSLALAALLAALCSCLGASVPLSPPARPLTPPQERNGRHPVLVGHYVSGRQLPSGQREPKTVCVKNCEAADILGTMQRLRDEIGGKAKSWNKRHWRAVESVQGEWTPLTRIQ